MPQEPGRRRRCARSPTPRGRQCRRAALGLPGGRRRPKSAGRLTWPDRTRSPLRRVGPARDVRAGRSTAMCHGSFRRQHPVRRRTARADRHHPGDRGGRRRRPGQSDRGGPHWRHGCRTGGVGHQRCGTSDRRPYRRHSDRLATAAHHHPETGDRPDTGDPRRSPSAHPGGPGRGPGHRRLRSSWPRQRRRSPCSEACRPPLLHHGTDDDHPGVQRSDRGRPPRHYVPARRPARCFACCRRPSCVRGLRPTGRYPPSCPSHRGTGGQHPVLRWVPAAALPARHRTSRRATAPQIPAPQIPAPRIPGRRILGR